MRKLIVLALITAMCAVGATAAYAATRTVSVGNNYFVRESGKPTVTIRRNSTVKWRWVERGAHNVVVSSGPVKFKSKILRTGSYSRKMTRRGTYNIYCTIHGRSDQSMKLVVK